MHTLGSWAPANSTSLPPGSNNRSARNRSASVVSDEARERVWGLIERQKQEPLAAEDEVELDHYMEVEHLLRLAKARARQLLAHEQRG